jgi:lysophospholipase L1-like esterase
MQDTRPADSDAERIVFLGDSFTWGWGVENDEVFTEVLQDKLGGAALVRNFGVNAYSTAQELLMLEKHALSAKPDVVVVMFFSNDLNENVDVKEGRRPLFELIDDELVPRNQPVERASVGAFKLLIRRSVALALLKNGYYQIRGTFNGKTDDKPVAEQPQEAYSEEKWQLLNPLLKKLQTSCAEANPACQLQVVYIPEREEVIGYKTRGNSATAVRVAAICDAAGIRFLDLSRGLYEAWQDSTASGQNATPIYLPVDDHWDAAGHAAVANILFDDRQDDDK